TSTINWADGITTLGTIVPGVLGAFNVVGTHTYEEGTYAASVTIRDTGGAQASVVSTFTVNDQVLTPAAVPTPIAAIEGEKFSGSVGTFTDANPLGTVSDFSVTIAWGDGSSSPGTVAQQADGSFVVHGSHTYAQETAAGSPLPVVVTVRDVGGQMATINTTA